MNDGMAQRLRAAGATDPTDLRLTLRELLQLHGEASGAVLLMVADVRFKLTVPVRSAMATVLNPVISNNSAYTRIGSSPIKIAKKSPALGGA